ncbi:MAG: acyl-CoA thioesterase [Phycisphaerae bacterium]|nr:acyl-CoA thioesterase [Phycisphaerae bacterium]
MAESINECTIETRVRYYEVDRQNAVHHSNYARYFEMGRTELLRQNGMDYKDLEDAGCMLVVAKLDCRFKYPATYDEILKITTKVTKTDRVRIEHYYKITRASDGHLLCDGNTTLVHVNREGKLQALPEFLGRD